MRFQFLYLLAMGLSLMSYRPVMDGSKRPKYTLEEKKPFFRRETFRRRESDDPLLRENIYVELSDFIKKMNKELELLDKRIRDEKFEARFSFRRRSIKDNKNIKDFVKNEIELRKINSNAIVKENEILSRIKTLEEILPNLSSPYKEEAEKDIERLKRVHENEKRMGNCYEFVFNGINPHQARIKRFYQKKKAEVFESMEELRKDTWKFILEQEPIVYSKIETSLRKPVEDETNKRLKELEYCCDKYENWFKFKLRDHFTECLKKEIHEGGIYRRWEGYNYVKGFEIPCFAKPARNNPDFRNKSLTMNGRDFSRKVAIFKKEMRGEMRRKGARIMSSYDKTTKLAQMSLAQGYNSIVNKKKEFLAQIQPIGKKFLDVMDRKIRTYGDYYFYLFGSSSPEFLESQLVQIEASWVEFRSEAQQMLNAMEMELEQDIAKWDSGDVDFDLNEMKDLLTLKSTFESVNNFKEDWLQLGFNLAKDRFLDLTYYFEDEKTHILNDMNYLFERMYSSIDVYISCTLIRELEDLVPSVLNPVFKEIYEPELKIGSLTADDIVYENCMKKRGHLLEAGEEKIMEVLRKKLQPIRKCVETFRRQVKEEVDRVALDADVLFDKSIKTLKEDFCQYADLVKTHVERELNHLEESLDRQNRENEKEIESLIVDGF